MVTPSDKGVETAEAGNYLVFFDKLFLPEGMHNPGSTYAASSPVNVPVPEPNVSISSPSRRGSQRTFWR